MPAVGLCLPSDAFGNHTAGGQAISRCEHFAATQDRSSLGPSTTRPVTGWVPQFANSPWLSCRRYPVEAIRIAFRCEHSSSLSPPAQRYWPLGHTSPGRLRRCSNMRPTGSQSRGARKRFEPFNGDGGDKVRLRKNQNPGATVSATGIAPGVCQSLTAHPSGGAGPRFLDR